MVVEEEDRRNLSTRDPRLAVAVISTPVSRKLISYILQGVWIETVELPLDV